MRSSFQFLLYSASVNSLSARKAICKWLNVVNVVRTERVWARAFKYPPENHELCLSRTSRHLHTPAEPEMNTLKHVVNALTNTPDAVSIGTAENLERNEFIFGFARRLRSARIAIK